VPSRQEIANWFGEWLGLIVGLLLVLFGIWGYWNAKNPLVHIFAEPSLIAGVLTLTVDPFLKRRLLKEASQDIFHHLIGFALPEAIKDRIKDIVLTTKVYRHDMELTFDFLRDNREMKLDCEYRFDVTNPSSHKVPFSQLLKFEKQEQAKLRSVSCSAGRPGYGKNLQLAPDKKHDEPLVWEGPEIDIPPGKEKTKIWFRAEYSVVRQLSDVLYQHFTQPTVRLTLRIRSKPDNLKLTVSSGGTQYGNEWVYDRVFMPGDEVVLRWESVENGAGSEQMLGSEAR
jgi:hypothetical protein